MTNILLVDDNANNRLTLELLLEDINDVKLYEAQNGQEAIKICQNHQIDLIYMDIMMPVLDGIEATKEIKKFAPNIMIIALSALDDYGSKKKMILAGAEDYLTKPIEADLFLQRTINYITIVSRRGTIEEQEESINPFTKKLFHRQLHFSIPHDRALSEFWDFFLNDNYFTCKDMSDHVRIIYGIGLWLLQKEQKFKIIVEGNDKNIFISVKGTKGVSKQTVHNLCQKHLPEATFVVDNNNIFFQLTNIEREEIEALESTTEKQVLKTDEETKKILSKTHSDSMDAAEYVATTAISIMPKLEALEFLENNLDIAIIHFEHEKNEEALEQLCSRLSEYNETIEMLQDFEHLAYGIKTLISFLHSLKEKTLEDDKVATLTNSLLNLLQDLSSWREQIFIKQEALNIHYLDASLLSSCVQIEAIFDEKVVDEGDDLEFF